DGVGAAAAQLEVVVAVRVRIEGVRIIRVVHAGVEVRARGVLMVETDRVPGLLTRNGATPGRRVVEGAGRVISVVELDRALHDVLAGRPDRRNSEPAVVAVRGIADLDPPAHCATPALS